MMPVLFTGSLQVWDSLGAVIKKASNLVEMLGESLLRRVDGSAPGVTQTSRMQGPSILRSV